MNKQNYLDKVGIPMVLTLIMIVLMSTVIVGCNEVKDVPDYSILEENNTEMTGDPVNIGLSGQIEMCEREPESILCEEDEN